MFMASLCVTIIKFVFSFTIRYRFNATKKPKRRNKAAQELQQQLEVKYDHLLDN